MIFVLVFFFFKQKTAYEMRISDWSSDVCSSDLIGILRCQLLRALQVSHGFLRVCLCQRPNHTPVQVNTGMAAGSRSNALPSSSLPPAGHTTTRRSDRSEERRVGKECVSTGRSRGSPDH